MKSRTAQWFICKVRYEKMQEGGMQKKVTESHVIEAVSVTEAVERITEEMSAYISGEFEVKQEGGMQKKVTETYVIDAVSFAEAEERIIEEMSAYISGEFNVKAVQLAPFSEIFFDERNDNADKYYKAKLNFITIDENSGNEKRQSVTYLIQAPDFNIAVENVDEVMGGTLIDYEISSIAETAILDVFQYVKKDEPKQDAE